MTGWLVNDRLTSIPGTTTFWMHLLESIPGLVDMSSPLHMYEGLADRIEKEAERNCPDYIIRNAAYFRPLDVACPAVSIVQDVINRDHIYGTRAWIVDTCCSSSTTVFNTEYTRLQYPELVNAPHRIIPIGTDDTLFSPCEPDETIPEGSVLWVGSGHSVKGFNLARQLAAESDRPWVFVMKDDTEVDSAAVVLRRIDHKKMARVASACAVGVCTSRQETQHLAGIEMGMCGLPLVVTNVGIYHDREEGPWGMVSKGDWTNEIEKVSGLDGVHAALYWRKQGLTVADSMSSWRTLVNELEHEYVPR